MSSPDGAPNAADGSSTTSPPRPSTGGGRPRSLVVPLIALLVVGGLLMAALTGGAPDDEATADGDQAPDEQPIAVDEPDGQDTAVDGDATAPVATPDVDGPSEEVRQLLDGLARREPDDPRALGDVDAPVVMIEWADFLCPYCGTFARETEPELVERYVEAGILRIEWRDLPFQGEEALLAAVAGQAAAEQDAFWALHELLFDADLRRGDGRLDREFLVTAAAELGLDVARFEASLDDPEVAARVQEDFALGQGIGITGTPAFIIAGLPMAGAQPLEAFVAVIEMAAAEAGVEVR